MARRRKLPPVPPETAATFEAERARLRQARLDEVVSQLVVAGISEEQIARRLVTPPDGSEPLCVSRAEARVVVREAIQRATEELSGRMQQERAASIRRVLYEIDRVRADIAGGETVAARVNARRAHVAYEERLARLMGFDSPQEVRVSATYTEVALQVVSELGQEDLVEWAAKWLEREERLTAVEQPREQSRGMNGAGKTN